MKLPSAMAKKPTAAIAIKIHLLQSNVKVNFHEHNQRISVDQTYFILEENRFFACQRFNVYQQND